MASHADRQTIFNVLREFHGIVVVIDDSLKHGVVIKTPLPKEESISSVSGGPVVVDLVKWELSGETFDALILRRTLPGGK